MSRTLAAALVALVVGAPGAVAADLRSPPVTAVPAPIPQVLPDYAFSWTGLYLGAHGGWQRFDTTLSGDRGTLTGDAFVGGIQGGFSYQLPSSVVFGIEADLTFGPQSDRRTNGPETVRGELDWTGSVRARVGYAFDRFLIYGTGGIALGDYELKVTDTSVPGTTKTDDTLFGWTVGLGAEYALTNNLTFGAQYRFTQFGDADLRAPGGDKVKGDLDLHDFRLGLNWKF